ncbi:MAG: cupin domain-containing protein [Azospirillaceae bacterium]
MTPMDDARDGADARLEHHLLPGDGTIPNNPRLPLLVYRGVLEGDRATAEGCRALFARNGWSEGGWVNGVFAYHHYHAGTHEVLGVIGGEARLRLGGEGGIEATVAAGDVVVIPAGVGHKNLGSSGDFRVVGGYPAGASVDMHRDDPADHDRAAATVAAVPLPDIDPVAGPDGPMLRLWR